MPARFPFGGIVSARDDGIVGVTQSKRPQWTRFVGDDGLPGEAVLGVMPGEAVLGVMPDEAVSGATDTQQAVVQDSSWLQALNSTNDVQTVRRVITSLPRPQTFHRQQSEKRERLLQIPDFDPKRRADSVDPKQSRSLSGVDNMRSLNSIPQPHSSAPDLVTAAYVQTSNGEQPQGNESPSTIMTKQPTNLQTLDGQFAADMNIQNGLMDDTYEDILDEAAIEQQYRDHWILNLSMHFRDKSNREKFFITYAQTPNMWRRMTISLDYRDAPSGSLEAELGELHHQRDKSFRIFDSLRESLPEIQFYDTVTNLKLQTTPEDGQLHVHVREDANEIIDYPSALLLSHIDCDRFTESEVCFHSHFSGFVYKVVVDGQILIKKEIPGPDTIDEFLYEVNALDSLQDCENVIQLKGLITSNDGSEIKGLLIPYAEKGALVDVLYDWQEEDLPLSLRLKWVRQIIQGLSNVHEAGFVQGDFTLSNIVIDENDDAHIIDINRRGCPVGWEPPELSRLIDHGQRISMYIGVKTDLYQLGMVLWALAELNDEPERCDRPLPQLESVPPFYQHIVSLCLEDQPQARPSASILLRMMENGLAAMGNVPQSTQSRSFSNTASHRSDKEYIDPAIAITLDDVKGSAAYLSAAPSRHPSSSYRHDDGGSPLLPHSRGRSPGYSSRRRRSSVYDGAATSATSLSVSPGRPVEVHSDIKLGSTYPQEISPNDLEDHSPLLDRVPHLYHAPRHEDSGFHEGMLESLSFAVDKPVISEGQNDASRGESEGCITGTHMQ